jgi:UDP-N-acetylmuramate--alanine ligase
LSFASANPSVLAAKRVHFVGAGGVGVSAVARCVHELGIRVTGSDQRASQITRALAELGCEISIGHDPGHVRGADCVVHSTAVDRDNVELAAARSMGVPVVHRSVALGELMARHARAVAVMGTHGKGTVSAMLVCILDCAGHYPGFAIGALLENYGRTNARITDGAFFVAEVDESDGSLVNVTPTLAVLTNLEPDHLNYYRDLAHLEDRVVEALARPARLTKVVANGASPSIARLIPRVPNAPWTLFGVEGGVTATAVSLSPNGARFTLVEAGTKATDVELVVPGAYNVENALAAAAAARSLGVSPEHVAEGLRSYRGLENRFTARAVCGRRVVTDYASHPTAIRHAIATAAMEERPSVVVFRPWRYTLVRHLFDEFASAFDGAAQLVVTEIDAGGESSPLGLSRATLARAIRARGVAVTEVDGPADLGPVLDALAPAGVQVIAIGGEDLFAAIRDWSAQLEAALDE